MTALVLPRREILRPGCEILRPGVRDLLRRFVGAFSPPVVAPVATAGAAAAAMPWWNPDGATPAANTGAWLAKGAASLAASYLNLGLLGFPDIDPAVVGGVAPAWAAGTGWTFDGIGQYLITGYIPPMTVSVLVQFTGAVGGGSMFSAAAPLGLLRILNPWFGNHYFSHGNEAGMAGNIAAGNFCVTPNQAYRDGLGEAALTGLTADATGNLEIACHPGPSYFAGYTCVAFMMTDISLTAPQVWARATAMAAL